MEFNKKNIGSIIFELIIVFLGVLGAFIVERKLQDIQVEKNNLRNLDMLFSTIQNDTTKLTYAIKVGAYKEKLALSKKFVDRWLPTGKAPLDSLCLLLHQMTNSLVMWNVIDSDVLERLPEINNVENGYLKFLLFTYYKGSKDMQDGYARSTDDYVQLINKTVDVEVFIHSDKSPAVINPKLSKRTVDIKGFLGNELKNRCISYHSDVEEVESRLLNIKRLAAGYLELIDKERKKL